MKNDISKIPKGHYCYAYDAKTDECNHCPYLGFETVNYPRTKDSWASDFTEECPFKRLGLLSSPSV